MSEKLEERQNKTAEIAEEDRKKAEELVKLVHVRENLGMRSVYLLQGADIPPVNFWSYDYAKRAYVKTGTGWRICTETTYTTEGQEDKLYALRSDGAALQYRNPNDRISAQITEPGPAIIEEGNTCASIEEYLIQREFFEKGVAARLNGEDGYTLRRNSRY